MNVCSRPQPLRLRQQQKEPFRLKLQQLRRQRQSPHQSHLLVVDEVDDRRISSGGPSARTLTMRPEQSNSATRQLNEPHSQVSGRSKKRKLSLPAEVLPARARVVFVSCEFCRFREHWRKGKPPKCNASAFVDERFSGRYD